MKVKLVTIFLVIILLSTTGCVSFPPGTSLLTYGGVSYYGGRPVVVPQVIYQQPLYYQPNFGIGHRGHHHGGGYYQPHHGGGRHQPHHGGGHHGGGHHR